MDKAVTKRFELIVFDWDGTLFDSTALIARTLMPELEAAKGSIVNKIVFILPVILLLNWLLPWALTPLLMCGGLYLSYEGAEKIWEAVSGHSKSKEAPALVKGADYGTGPIIAPGMDAVLSDFNTKLEGLANGDPKAILDQLQKNGEAALKG